MDKTAGRNDCFRANRNTSSDCCRRANCYVFENPCWGRLGNRPKKAYAAPDVRSRMNTNARRDDGQPLNDRILTDARTAAHLDKAAQCCSRRHFGAGLHDCGWMVLAGHQLSLRAPK